MRRFLAFTWTTGSEFEFAVNDLEAVVFGSRPELVAFAGALRGLGASLAMLSGSGSTMFGAFPDEASRASASDALRQGFPDWKLLPVRTVPWGARVVDEDGGGAGHTGD